MIAMLLRNLALTLLLALLFVALLEQFNPAPPQLLVDFHHADYPVCVTVHNTPLQPHRTNPHARRSDRA